MTTRRTTMKSRTMQAPKRALAAATRPKAALETCIKSDEFDKQLLRARKGAEKFARSAQEQATAATKVVRRSMKEAVAALKVATNKAARRVMEATAAKPAKATRRHAAG